MQHPLTAQSLAELCELWVPSPEQDEENPPYPTAKRGDKWRAGNKNTLQKGCIVTLSRSPWLKATLHKLPRH